MKLRLASSTLALACLDAPTVGDRNGYSVGAPFTVLDAMHRAAGAIITTLVFQIIATPNFGLPTSGRTYTGSGTQKSPESRIHDSVPTHVIGAKKTLKHGTVDDNMVQWLRSLYETTRSRDRI